MSWLGIGLLVCSFNKNTEELCQSLGMESARKPSCSRSLVWGAGEDREGCRADNQPVMVQCV